MVEHDPIPTPRHLITIFEGLQKRNLQGKSQFSCFFVE
jgi:hypothetical protein